ncbi:MAG: hypothetical protein Q8L22_22465 [Reyranella sp.]|nr:hypothetical protein [Reyranella sp.]
MTNDESVVASAFGFQRQADRLRGAAELRQRMEEAIGWIEAMDFEANTRPSDVVELGLQARNVGRLLDRVKETLAPDAGGTKRLNHMRPMVVDIDCCYRIATGVERTIDSDGAFLERDFSEPCHL